MWFGLHRRRNRYIPRNSFSVYSKQDILEKHGEEWERTGDSREVSECHVTVIFFCTQSYYFRKFSRLHMAVLGGVLAPIGLWWFAW